MEVELKNYKDPLSKKYTKKKSLTMCRDFLQGYIKNLFLRVYSPGRVKFRHKKFPVVM